MARKSVIGLPQENFNDILPRTIFTEANPERLDKMGATFTGNVGSGSLVNQMATYGASQNILRNPSRRFYDPEITTTAIYLPRTIKQKNRWCRWFYDHDELVGAVLDLHAELPYSRAEIVEKDPHVKRLVEECLDKIKFFSMLPVIDLEFMKIGEVFIHTPWDDTKGMWNHIIIHNPDFAEVRFTPFADQECSIELIPDDELKSIVHSTKPEDQQLKKRIPQDVFKRVLTGKNITLDPDEVTHIARRSNPYDIRGTSIIARIFRLLMYEDKLREAQITIADNFVYPLKIFKLGDAQKGWIPNETHQRALAQMLQQATFDPNFSLIYHYGLNVEFHTVADKVMRLEKEWSDIAEKKMVALGVGKQFLSGESTFACFVEGTKITTPYGFKNIEDISKNDSVIDKDGYVKKVVDNWCEGTPKDLIKIKLWGGKELLCTSNHEYPIWAWPRHCACGCKKEILPGRAFAHTPRWLKNKIIFKDAGCGRVTVRKKFPKGIPVDYDPIKRFKTKDIREWDYLMIPRKFNEVKTDVTEDQAKLLGYFLAEGNYSKHHKTKEITGINLTFNVTEKDTRVKDAKKLCEKFGIPIIQIEEKTNFLRLRSANREEFKDKVLWFKKHAGEYSFSKKLSEEVMCWPLNLKRELIKGLFLGDGCNQINNSLYKKYTTSLNTTSKILAYQIELILAQLGFPVNWAIIDDSARGRHTNYRLHIYGKFAFDLAKLLWEGESKIKFKKSKRFFSQKAWVDEDYVYLMVRSVKTVKNDKKVYNLTIKDTHSYLVENVGTFNSANVALQTQLARYKAKRDLFEVKWINKIFTILAERNDWYRRDKKELIGQFRVKRKGQELGERLIVPRLIWHKKLMMRDDQSFLTFMNNVYAQGKGPISTISLLQYMGMSLEDELENKVKQTELEEKIGSLIHPVTQVAGGLTASIKGLFKRGGDNDTNESVLTEAEKNLIVTGSNAFIGEEENEKKILNSKELQEKENNFGIETTKHSKPINEKTWFNNIESPNIPSEVKLKLITLQNKLSAIDKKNNGNFKEGLNNESKNIQTILVDLYKQGKLHAYGITGFFPIYKQYYASRDDLTDYSDLILSKEFEDWVKKIAAIDIEKDTILRHIRNLGNTCFCYGQLKGYQEQGVYNVKIANVLINEGLRYATKELLDKEWNLSSLVSPNDEIIILHPCIEGFDSEEFNNNVDPHINRYQDFLESNISIKNCPIEYVSSLNRYISKMGTYLNRQYDSIVFVKDVIDLKEWDEHQSSILEDKHAGLGREIKGVMIVNSLNYEKIRQRGTVPTFHIGRTLYVSNWIGMEDCPLTTKLINYLDVVDEYSEKIIRKAFKKSNLDLTPEDMQTYRVFGYIVPMSDDPENPRGFRISEESQDNVELDYKLRHGKIWDLDGKCKNADDTDEVRIFKDNLRLWVDYPHLLSDELKKSFEIL